MRILNVRFLVLMLAAGGVISLSAYALHGFQVRRNADKILDAAKEAEKQNDLPKAVDFLQRYVQLVPLGDLTPLVDLGMLQIKLERRAEAFQTFDRAVRQDPGRSDLERQLVELAFRLRRFGDAIPHLKNLLRQFPEEIDLREKFADCQYALNELDGAEATLRQVLEDAPDSLKTYGRLADLLRGPLKNPLAAIEVLDELVARNDESALAYAIRGSRWLEHGQEFQRTLANRPAAEPVPSSATENETTGPASPVRSGNDEPLAVALNDAKLALKLDGASEEVLIFAIRCDIAHDDWEQARDQLNAALEQFPENPFLYGWLADAATHDGELTEDEQLQEAIRWYERGLEVLPKNADLMWNLTSRLIDDGQLEPARQRISQLQNLRHPLPLLNFLKARLLVAEKSWLVAIKTFDAARSALTDWPDIATQADAWKGYCYEQLGRHDLQLAEYQRALNANPRFVPARIGTAAALARLGDLEQAINEYEAIDPKWLTPLVRLRIAEVTVLANLGRPPAARNWAACEEKIAAIEEFGPAAAALRAEVLVAQGNFAQAEQLLLAAKAQMPDSMQVWSSLMNLAVMQGHDETASELLQQAEQSVEDSVELRLAKARHLVYLWEKASSATVPSPASADRALRPEPTTTDIPPSADEREELQAQRELARRQLWDRLSELAAPPETFPGNVNELRSGIAALMLRAGDYANAENICLDIARQETEQNNWKIRLLLFDVAYRAGKTEEMAKVLDELNVIENSGPLWHYGSAVRDAVLARLQNQPDLYERAKSHLRAIRGRNWARVPAMLGLINDAQGDKDAAIVDFVQAIELGERNAEILERALAILEERQQYQEADQLIRKLQERQTAFTPALTARATEVYMNLEDTQRALAFLNQVPMDSPRPSDHFWAGKKLSLIGKHDQAERHFRRALELDETSPLAWIRLVWHLVQVVRLDDAEQTLRQAESKVSPIDAPLVLAAGLELLHRIDDAEEQWQRAVSLAPDNLSRQAGLVDFYIRQERLQQAEQLLERLLANPKVAGDDLVWCRRNMAIVNLAKAAPNLELATRYIAANLEANPGSLPDRRVKGLILSRTKSNAQATGEAIEILEDVLSQTPASVTVWGVRELHFELAKLYVRTKQDDRVHDHMLKVVQNPTGDVRAAVHLMFYVDFLIAHDQFTDAESWLRSLVKMSPNDFETIRLGANLRFRSQRYAEVTKWLDQQLAKFSASAPEKLQRTRDTALLLEAFASELETGKDVLDEARPFVKKFLARAEQLLKELEQDRPDAALARAAFYIRRGQIDESLGMLEREFGTAKPEEIATVCAALLSVPNPTSAQLARAEQLLRKSIEVRGRTPFLLMGLADHLNLTGQFAAAEELYREVLAAEPDHVLVLNNLSVLLALLGKRDDEPLQLIQRAIALNSHPALLDSRGTIYLARGETALAEVDLRQANSLRPTAGGFFRLALVAFRQKKIDSARQLWAQAKERNLKIDLLHPLERPLARQLELSLK